MERGKNEKKGKGKGTVVVVVIGFGVGLEDTNAKGRRRVVVRCIVFC